MRKLRPIFFDKATGKDILRNISFFKRKLPEKLVAQEKRKLMVRLDGLSATEKTNAIGSKKVVILRYIAASVALILSFAIFSSLDGNTYYTSYGEVSRIQLPDGSSVTLNGNSSISYSGLDWKFFGKRSVKLEGEAFFDVVKKESSGVSIKFQVFTENLQVHVLGTKFNIIDRSEHEVVVLEEGEVQVSLPDRDTPFQLVPGDYIRYSKGDHNIERGSVVTEGFTSWKDNYILLDNKTLGDLAQIITTVYGRKVVFKNETDKQIILEGKVPSDEIHVLVKALRLATKLNISMEGDVVFIN